VLLLAAGAAVFVWLALEYRWFSNDVAKSRARLPATLRTTLAPSKNVLSQRQVTLVRYSKGVSTGGGVLFSTNPSTKVISFLTISPVSTLGGREVRSYNVRELVTALRTDADLDVRHVAIVNLDNVGALVDGIGGIHVHNPTAFDVPVAGGTVLHFPAGNVFLDGPHAVAYLRRDTLTGDALGRAGLDVLRGIVQRLLQPASLGTLQVTGTALANSTATDLSDADVVGLVYLRLDGGTARECALPPRASLTSELGDSIISTFRGAPGATSGLCTSHPIDRQVILPPKSVVRLVQRFGWGAFVAAAGLMLAIMLLLGSALILRARRMTAPALEDERPAPLVAVRPPRQHAAEAGGAAGRNGRPWESAQTAAAQALDPATASRTDEPTPAANPPAEIGASTSGDPVAVPPAEPEAPAVTDDSPVVPTDSQPVVASADIVSPQKKHDLAARVRAARARHAVLLDRSSPEHQPHDAPSAQIAVEQRDTSAPALGGAPPVERERRSVLTPALNAVTAATATVVGGVRSTPSAVAGRLRRTNGGPGAVAGGEAREGAGVGAGALRRLRALRPRIKASTARRTQHMGRGEALRYWFHTHQEIIWAVGLGAVVALVAGAFAGLI
jgi:hypothetical protein